jgi:hypothetical protein
MDTSLFILYRQLRRLSGRVQADYAPFCFDCSSARRCTLQVLGVAQIRHDSPRSQPNLALLNVSQDSLMAVLDFLTEGSSIGIKCLST